MRSRGDGVAMEHYSGCGFPADVDAQQAKSGAQGKTDEGTD